ncbi:hypothetical protein V1525DRAFT_392758 [Lipomyces kononenkoae]|uniref:Uncharacterized protein n=1 Tax=Lipomyces kononenkoae TaxID=34357 RepID=A0ACC3TC19_LIPKO
MSYIKSSIMQSSPVYFAIARIDDGQRIYDFAHFRDYERALISLKTLTHAGGNPDYTDRGAYAQSGCFLSFEDAVEWLDHQDQRYKAEMNHPAPWRPAVIGVAAHADDKGGRKREASGNPRPAIACAVYFGDNDSRNCRHVLDSSLYSKHTAELYGVQVTLQRARRYRDFTLYVRHKSTGDEQIDDREQRTLRVQFVTYMPDSESLIGCEKLLETGASIGTRRDLILARLDAANRLHNDEKAVIKVRRGKERVQDKKLQAAICWARDQIDQLILKN